MIQILIELHSGGDPTNKKVMAAIVIANDLTGTRSVGNYEYGIARTGKKAKQGKVKGFLRRKHDAVDLLKLVLDDYFKNVKK